MAKEKVKSYSPLKRRTHFKTLLIVPGTTQNLFPVIDYPADLSAEPAETATYLQKQTNKQSVDLKSK